MRILGTGFSSAMEMLRLSTGQVCCLLSHCTMQSAQNACSHLNKYYFSSYQIFLTEWNVLLLIIFIKPTNLTSGTTHSGARRGSSSTALQMGQMSSSSTEPSNLVTS